MPCPVSPRGFGNYGVKAAHQTLFDLQRRYGDQKRFSVGTGFVGNGFPSALLKFPDYPFDSGVALRFLVAEANILSQEFGFAVEDPGALLIVIEQDPLQVEDRDRHGNLVQDPGNQVGVEIICLESHPPSFFSCLLLSIQESPVQGSQLFEKC
jgi:hypothetical protein